MSAIPQKSFAAGEIAPALYARTDVNKYGIALRTCRNMMVMRPGGATNRPGSRYVCQTRYYAKTVRLIPFIFNTSQTYMLEFGDSYMRVLNGGVQVTNLDLTITAVTNANPGQISYTTASGHPANNNEVAVSGVAGALGKFLNGRNFLLKNQTTLSGTTGTFTLAYLNGNNVDTTSWGTYTSGGICPRIYEISTTYVEADLQALVFVQQADTITITHPTYPPRKVTRSASNSWSIDTITFTGVVTVNVTGFTTGGGAGTVTTWATTVESDETGEESVALATVQSAATPTSGAPVTLTITLLGGVPPFGGFTPGFRFNIYRLYNGIYGFIGSCYGGATATFVDSGVTPDITDSPPTARNPFASTDNYPACTTYYQNRQLFGQTNTLPETVYASLTGVYSNLRTKFPIQDDSPVTWTMAGAQVSKVKHMLPLGNLLIFTSTGEWAINGNAAGILTPSSINPSPYSKNGIGDLRPLIVSSTALYVQARGNIVRDLAFDLQVEGYRGDDITILSAHLFDGYTVRDWDFQQIPNAIVWAVRSDGVLLGLTYVKEQQLFAWHRHDFQDATVEQACVIPEGNEDVLYLVIKRSVNGETRRYIERLSSRFISNITSAIFMDSALSYDGTNAAATTMTLSGGTVWGNGEPLTLTASASFFASTDVGNRIDITDSAGAVVRCVITAYTSATVVTVMPQRNVPVILQGVARATWTKCVLSVSGLWHLEGKSISVLGDGFVEASPNNVNPENGQASSAAVTVTNGVATFSKPYGIIHAGLPIIADMETLDIDQAQGESIADKGKRITRVTSYIQASRGGWYGPKPPTSDSSNPLEFLTELKLRTPEDSEYDNPVSLYTKNVPINIRAEWNTNGRVFFRQVDPLPFTMLSIVPTGDIPFTR